MTTGPALRRDHGGATRHAHGVRDADDLAGLRLGIAYDRLTCALQVVSAQFILLTADRSRLVDARDAGDARVLAIAEARDVLAEAVPSDRDARLHADLGQCLVELEALAASLRTPEGLSDSVGGRDAFVRRLCAVASRLARSADHERGLTFFGSGGCGDSKHRHLHI